MTSYDKVLINQGTPILYTELNELQDIINANFKDFSTLLKGAVKGVQDLAYTLASNSITVTGAKVYAVGKVFTLPSTTVSSLFATTSSATGSLYAKITDSVVTGSTDPSIVNNNIGPTASRIKYNIVLAFTTGTIPADITGQAPGSNTWYVPMLSLTGTSTTVPTSDETVYPFTKLNDAQTLGGKSLSGIENDISNARSGGALDAEAWVKQYGLGSTSYPLATGTDLNTVKTNGFYKVNAGVNVPPRVPNDNTAIWHYVIVQTHDSNNWTSQMAIEFNTGTVFVRSSVQGGSSSTVWGPWTQLATTALGTTSGPGILQLTDSVSSTSTTTASTPNSVKTVNDSLTSHTGNTSNPHNTTASQVGAPPIARKVTAGTGLTGGGDLSADRTIALDTTYLGSTSRPGLLQLTDSTSSTSTTTASTPNSVKTVNDSLTSHKNNTSNPHSVTSSQVNKITADSFAGTAGPANFPIGISVMEVTTATGYPTATGTLITNFLTTDRGFQMFVDKATEVMSIRVADSSQPNGWGAFKTVVDTTVVASTSKAGLVQLTDSTASTSTTTGATPNSVKTVNDALTSHTGNTSNPHNVTSSQVGAPPTARKVSAGTGLTGGGDLSADRTISLDTTYLGTTSKPGLVQLTDSTSSTSTTTGATANSVKMALDWVKGFGLGTGGITVTDLNVPSANGYYQGNNMANAPTTDYYSVFHNEWDASTASQLAIGNSTEAVWVRGKGGGIWGAWKQLATTALATTSAPGLVQLVDSDTSTDTTKAGTANAVRQALVDAKAYTDQEVNNAGINTQTASLVHGANTLTTSQATNVKPKLYGRSLVDLFGKVGGFEPGFPYLAVGGNTFAYDTSDFIQGTQSGKGTRGASSSESRVIILNAQAIKQNSYYVAIGYAKFSATTGWIEIAINDTSNATVFTSPHVAGTTSWAPYILTHQVTEANAGQFRIDLCVNAGNDWAKADAWRLYEITQADFTAINNGTMSQSQILAKYPYVESIEHVNGAYLQQTSKNLLPSFHTNDHNDMTITDAYSINYTASASNQYISQSVYCAPNQAYTLSVGTLTNAKAKAYWFDENNVSTLLYDGPAVPYTFTTDPNAVRLEIQFVSLGSGAVVITNPQLELGSGATAFEAQNASYLYVPYQLASNMDGSIQDTAYEREGMWYKNANYKTVDLDGSLAWVFATDLTGYKIVKAPALTQNFQSNTSTFTDFASASKFSGQVLPRNGTTTMPVDSFQLGSQGSADTMVYIAISDTDSGWGETYTPTAQEIQAYFLGWKMYDSSQANTVPAHYNGTGTKAWAYRVAGGTTYVENGYGLAGGTGALPTTLAPSPNGEWKDYQVTYQLVAPQETAIQTEGALELVSGQNTINVNEGVIVREIAVIQQVSYGSTNYYAFNVSTVSATWLNSRPLKQLLAIYQGDTPSTDYAVSAWEVLSDGTVRIPTTHVANSNDLTNIYVTYLTQLTANQQQVDITYDTSLSTLVQQNAEDIQGLTQQLTAVQETYASKNQPGYIYATLQNAWVNYASDESYWAQAKYMKDSMGFVHIVGMIKGGTATGGTLLFKLPKGYRPKARVQFAVDTYASSTAPTEGLGIIAILGDGTVEIVQGSATYLALNTPPFLAEQ